LVPVFFVCARAVPTSSRSAAISAAPSSFFMVSPPRSPARGEDVIYPRTGLHGFSSPIPGSCATSGQARAITRLPGSAAARGHWSPGVLLVNFFSPRPLVRVGVIVFLARIEDVRQPLHAAVQTPEGRLASTQRLGRRQALHRQPASRT